MRPGQLTPNEFENALLEYLVSKEPSLTESIQRLHVLSREYTGVGSFTRFTCEGQDENAPMHSVNLDTSIKMPGVPNGMGAVLFLKGGKPDCLEVFAYGDDHWDGVFDGFSIQHTD